jgi:hypothetical protein
MNGETLTLHRVGVKILARQRRIEILTRHPLDDKLRPPDNRLRPLDNKLRRDKFRLINNGLTICEHGEITILKSASMGSK